MIRQKFDLIFLLATVLVGANADRVAEKDITFFLSNSVLSYEEFTTGNYGWLGIDPTKEVKIICHGCTDSVSTTWYVDAKEGYEKKGGANVIGVDWSPHSTTFYTVAVRRTERVGYYIALLIVDMAKNLRIPLSRFHLIGHSLGSHISGYAGQYVQSMTGEKIGRITGLDPARPSFEGKAADRRLSDDDAVFVDVIHTNGGTLGYRASIGHVDYFPNAGSTQRGCGLLVTNSCSHNRAPMYFYESINSNGFISVACSSARDFNRGRCDNNTRIVMGENVNQTVRGDFYLNTASSPPFALG